MSLDSDHISEDRRLCFRLRIPAEQARTTRCRGLSERHCTENGASRMASFRKALFHFLRRWGCRQFKIEDEGIAGRSLSYWWRRHAPSLPAPHQALEDSDDPALQLIAEAYDDLRLRHASWQERVSSVSIRRFGPAGAAKILFVIRPKACTPWDEAIRKSFTSAEDGAGYTRHIRRSQAQLAEAARDAGSEGKIADLPSLVGRELSSPVKLVDEYDYVRFTQRFDLPSPAVLIQWAGWASNGGS